jgi:ATP-dependent exoDNAse (exonuclease V) beta subunit
MKKPTSNSTLISASAGSGKTYQLAGRFLRILLEKDSNGGRVDPTTVLATTFTRGGGGGDSFSGFRLAGSSGL